MLCSSTADFSGYVAGGLPTLRQSNSLSIVDLMALKIEDSLITAERISGPTQKLQITVLILNVQCILNAMFTEGAVMVSSPWT
jgi:hypothetical protein